MSGFWKWTFYVIAFISLLCGIMMFLYGEHHEYVVSTTLVVSMVLLLIGVLSLGFAAVLGALQKISDDTHAVSFSILEKKLREPD